MLDLKANLEMLKRWILYGIATTEQAVALIDDLIETVDGTKLKWVSVTERLPGDECDCWVHCEDGEEFVIHFDPCIDKETERFGEWKDYYDPVSLGWSGSEWFPICGVTHWMERPDPPYDDFELEEDEEEECEEWII